MHKCRHSCCLPQLIPSPSSPALLISTIFEHATCSCFVVEGKSFSTLAMLLGISDLKVSTLSFIIVSHFCDHLHQSISTQLRTKDATCSYMEYFVTTVLCNIILPANKSL